MTSNGIRTVVSGFWLIGGLLGAVALAEGGAGVSPRGQVEVPGSSGSGGQPEGISAAGWSRVVEQLAGSRYEARPLREGADEAWRFLNPEVGLEARFERGGMRIGLRGGADWGLRLRAFGPAGFAGPVAEPALVAKGNRIEYRRPGLTEWYVNDRRGVEQGFTVETAPAGHPDRLEFLLELAGTLDAVAGGDGDSLSLRDAVGSTLLRYDGLHAFDAEGRVLSARLEIVAGSDRPAALRIEVDVTGAAYPVVVDPLIWTQEARLTASHPEYGDVFGRSVSISGDTVVVGTPKWDDEFVFDSGSAYVFERNAGGADAWGEVAKLTAADGHVNDGFGYSVSIDGDTVVVGAWLDDDAGSDSGSAYVFERDAGGVDAWGQVAKLTPPDAAANLRFGYSVGISGDTVVAGAWFYDDDASTSGSAYVFERNSGGADGWGQVAKLTAADAAAGDSFGRSVSISGDTVVVGAPSYSGGAYVFGRHAGGPNAWGEVAKLTAADLTASSLSISGDTVVVTARGGAYVFERHAGGSNAWGEVAKLTAADWLGSSVSISGDTVVANARGAAYVFERNAGGAGAWEQVAKLTIGGPVSISGDTVVVGASGEWPFGAAYIFAISGCSWKPAAKPVSSDAAAFDSFGYSVSISGDTVIVGAQLDDDGGSGSGSAYVFERNAGGADAWGEAAKLTAADAATGDVFGVSVSISGDTVVVGAFHDDDGGPDSGSAYVFERNAGGADAWGQVAKLTAMDAAAGDSFGRSVSINGDTVVVAASGDDDAGSASGSAYVFERNAGGANAWGEVIKLSAEDLDSNDSFGASVSISGDLVVVGATGDDDGVSDSGSAYVFERNAGGADGWGEVAKLKAADGWADDIFGHSVSISGDTVVVGARGDDDGGSDSGSAYVFERNAGDAAAWDPVAKLIASDAAAGDFFGNSVAISGDTVVVGAYRPGGTASGSAYVFWRNAGGADSWDQVAKLTAVGATAGDTFGVSVSIDGATTAVGAYRDDAVDRESGSAYVFNLKCAACGDGVRDIPEACDDGAANSDVMPDACRTSCTLPGCGDGVTDTGEACDEGGANSDLLPDACRTDCTFPACGDGVTDVGEACDDGNADDRDACSNVCAANVCGDGTINAGELCDDADPGTGDFCETGCAPRIRLSLRQEADGTLTLEWSSAFHPPGTIWSVLRATSPTALAPVAEREVPFHTEVPPDAELLFYRVVSRCGDGTVVEGEECDDGNQISLDGCRSDCTLE